MSLKQHFQLMAKYNQRVNKQLYAAAAKLTASDLREDKGAFFGSVLGTLNHILVGDILWLSRFSTHSPRYLSLSKIDQFPMPRSLDEEIFEPFDALRHARLDMDQIIINWINETEETDFEHNFIYKSMNGTENEKNFGEVVCHLFNHQTHHRGQVSTLLSQFGLDIGVTDFIIDIPNCSS